jgi:hypothetical protein
MGLLNKLRGTDDTKGAPPKAVVAAAMPMTGPGVKAVNRGRQQQTTEQWQNEAWYYWDAIGELRGPTVWIANAVSQADVHATELDPDTGKPTGPSDDVQDQAIAAQVLGGPSQRPGLLRLIALCWQVAGEAWIIIRAQGAGKPDQWLVLSGNKVKAKGTQWQYTDPFTSLEVILGPNDRLIRAWSPHPNDQAKADSSVRPALPICREIEKASQNLAARLDSRIAQNGVAVLADELSLTGEDFMAAFMQGAEANLQNPGQAAAQVPLAFNAPAEFIANGGAFAHFDLATQFDGQVVELRDNSRERLAATLDMPKQIAEGTQGEGNHWSDWQVEESTYKIFIEPLLKAVGDVLTEHWYRPALITTGRNAQQVELKEIGWDTTAIVARPDDTENLRDLHDRILISDEYMLTENGVPLEAMPSPEERTRRVLEKIVGGAPTLLADPNVAEAMDLGIEVSPVAAGVQAEVGAGGELEAPEPPPAPARGLPDTQGDVPEGLVAAAELIVYDALSRAGGRLLTNQNRGLFKSTPRHELHTVIETDQLHSLMEGSFEFTDQVAEAFGLDPQQFHRRVRSYVEHRLEHGWKHDRNTLRGYLT